MKHPIIITSNGEITKILYTHYIAGVQRIVFWKDAALVDHVVSKKVYK